MKTTSTLGLRRRASRGVAGLVELEVQGKQPVLKTVQVDQDGA
jgi:hypothetical protein